MEMRLECSGSHRGFDYRVIVMPMGYRCGYVRLPEGHPWYGFDFQDIKVSVHGGLTFSCLVKDDLPILENGYWIGFDCMHAFDIPDTDEMNSEIMRSYGYKIANMWGKIHGSQIRNRGYVESQCRNLCEGCAEVKRMEDDYIKTNVKNEGD